MSSEHLIEQLDYLELQLRVARLFVIEAQEISFFRPCKLGKPLGCYACKIKRHILKGRFH